jgi:5,10-methylene-tetrahydrofolate dehydrogenase/methenyl tetrahydrofolate cyclohydrolase
MSLIDCKALAQTILMRVASGIQDLGRSPVLAVLLVGHRKDSELYVKMKRRRAKSVGITVILKTLPETASQTEMESLIHGWNRDPTVDAIMVQLPLPDRIDEQRVVEQIALSKDVDGLHPLNLAGIAINKREPQFISCTPKACMAILDSVCGDLAGKIAVVVGRSNIVGLPLVWLLQNRNATVISCDKFTHDAQSWTRKADILISATGVPHLIRPDWVKADAIVLDVGIAKIQNKIVGDVDTQAVLQQAKWVTPVPGGVGPVTIAMLMENVLIAATQRQQQQARCGKIDQN